MINTQKLVTAGLRALVRVPYPHKKRLILDFLGIKKGEIVRRGGFSLSHVTQVTNGKGSSRPVDLCAYEIMREKLRDLDVEYIPTFEEAFCDTGIDADMLSAAS
jgi:hypothetical protein